MRLALMLVVLCFSGLSFAQEAGPPEVAAAEVESDASVESPVEVAPVAEPVVEPATSWSDIGLHIAEGVYPFVLAALTALFGFAIAWLRAHTRNVALRMFLSSVNDAVISSVLQIQQTMADGLKAAHADGKLTPEEATSVLKAAVVKAKALLGDRGTALALSAAGMGEAQLEAYLTAKIEASVANGKR